MATFHFKKTLPCVISLLDDQKRIDNINQHLKIEIPNLQIWKATNGKTTNFLPYVNRGIITEKYENEGRLGALGCIISHISVWDFFLNSDYEHLLILEDDVKLVPKFLDKFIKFMNEVPSDYDFNTLFYKNPLYRKIDGKMVKENYTPKELGVFINDSKNLYKPGILQGLGFVAMWGYCISKKGVTKILKSCCPFNEPIDNAIVKVVNLNRFTPNVNLVLMPYEFTSSIWSTNNKKNDLEVFLKDTRKHTKLI